MMGKQMKTLEFNYPVIQVLTINNTEGFKEPLSLSSWQQTRETENITWKYKKSTLRIRIPEKSETRYLTIGSLNC